MIQVSENLISLQRLSDNLPDFSKFTRGLLLSSAFFLQGEAYSVEYWAVPPIPLELPNGDPHEKGIQVWQPVEGQVQVQEMPVLVQGSGLSEAGWLEAEIRFPNPGSAPDTEIGIVPWGELPDSPVLTGPLGNEQLETSAVCESVSRLLHESPIEDGVSHPLDEWVGDRLPLGHQSLDSAARSLLVHSPPIGADLLQSLARQEYSHLVGWGHRLAALGLAQSSSLRARDAAVRLLEHLGDEEACELLEEYVGRETADWLAQYAKDVLIELGG